MDQSPQAPIPTGPIAPTPPVAPVPMHTAEAVPTGEWPGAFKAYEPSKEAIKFNFNAVLGLMGLTALVSIISNAATPSSSDQQTAVGLIVGIIANLVLVLLSAALAYVMIAGVKRQKMAVGEGLKLGWEKFLPFLGQSLLVGFISILSILLFVIPAFFIIPRLLLAPYYLFEGNLGAVDGIKASWNETRGHTSKIWGIIGVNILIGLLAFTIIGIPFAIYFYIMFGAADVILYFWIKNRNVAQTNGPIIQQV